VDSTSTRVVASHWNVASACGVSVGMVKADASTFSSATLPLPAGVRVAITAQESLFPLPGR
jgi:hypothetical protein